MAGMDMGQLLADQLVKAAKVVEEQLDAELNKLENMDEDEMEALVLISSLIWPPFLSYNQVTMSTLGLVG